MHRVDALPVEINIYGKNSFQSDVVTPILKAEISLFISMISLRMVLSMPEPCSPGLGSILCAWNLAKLHPGGFCDKKKVRI